MEEERKFLEDGGDVCQSMKYEVALGSLDVPEELRHLPDDTMEAMFKYFKSTVKRYLLGDEE